MTAAENFLTAILECGADDLSILENVGYSWDDVLERMDFPTSYGFNDLILSIFELGVRDIKYWIEERLEEPDISSTERSTLMLLDPEEDIEVYCNYTSSCVSFRNRSRVYHKYCEEALKYFHDMTGFVING